MNAAAVNPTLALRPMVVNDLVSVLRVERAAYAYPWSEGIFRDCLHVGYSCWVADCAGELRGHGVMSAAAGECHILNLCVHPEWQGQRIGRTLLRRLLALGRRRDADTAFLEVRPSNTAAIALYLSEGFSEVGRRRAYYPSRGGAKEDALIMAKALL